MSEQYLVQCVLCLQLSNIKYFMSQHSQIQKNMIVLLFFSVCMKKNTANGICKKYSKESHFSFLIRMLPAVVYISKLNYAIVACEEQLNFFFYLENLEPLQPLIDNFEETYIG